MSHQHHNHTLLQRERDELHRQNEEKILLLHDRIIRYNNLPEIITFSQPSRTIITKFSKTSSILSFHYLDCPSSHSYCDNTGNSNSKWKVSKSLQTAPIWIEEISKDIICIIDTMSNAIFYSIKNDESLKCTTLLSSRLIDIRLVSRIPSDITKLISYNTLIIINFISLEVKIYPNHYEIPTLILFKHQQYKEQTPPPNTILIIDENKFLLKNPDNTISLLKFNKENREKIEKKTQEMPFLIYNICQEERKIVTLHINSSSIPVAIIFSLDELEEEGIIYLDDSKLIMRSVFLLKGSRRILVNDMLIFSFC